MVSLGLSARAEVVVDDGRTPTACWAGPGPPDQVEVTAWCGSTPGDLRGSERILDARPGWAAPTGQTDIAPILLSPNQVPCRQSSGVLDYSAISPDHRMQPVQHPGQGVHHPRVVFIAQTKVDPFHP
ncbi:hypothetical protein KEM60_02993 [Austwickia sp. TVS 96-490-7B]|nr:hypothetical protein [Austwickia sp. TVS 96-490-7B]